MRKEITFIESKQESKEVYSFHFERPKGFSWRAGQHAFFSFLEEIEDPKRSRIFTIISIEDEEEVSFATKIIGSPSVFKKELMRLKKGDKMSLDGPYGDFTISEDGEYVGIAGGIGVTPFRSIMFSILSDRKQDKVKFDLVYSAKKGDFSFFDEFERLKKDDRIDVHYAEDRNEAKEKIEELIKEKKERAKFLICGPPALVQNYKKGLEEKEVSEDRIFIDSFYGY